MKLVPMQNENGSALTVVLFVLTLITLLGITAINTSNVELQIASNDQFVKMAFYNADNALYGTAKLISMSVNERGSIAAGPGTHASGIAYAQTKSHFYRQVAGFADYDAGDPDVDFNAGGINATADVRRLGQRYAYGGGAEFAAEGVAASTLVVDYEINATGISDHGATSELSATYRKVVGMPGGL